MINDNLSATSNILSPRECVCVCVWERLRALRLCTHTTHTLNFSISDDQAWQKTFYKNRTQKLAIISRTIYPRHHEHELNRLAQEQTQSVLPPIWHGLNLNTVQVHRLSYNITILLALADKTDTSALWMPRVIKMPAGFPYQKAARVLSGKEFGPQTSAIH